MQTLSSCGIYRTKIFLKSFLSYLFIRFFYNRAKLSSVFSVVSIQYNLQMDIFIVKMLTFAFSQTKCVVGSFNPAWYTCTTHRCRLKISFFYSLWLPDMCFWWGFRTAARNYFTGCCCRTSRGSCPSFTPPRWAWPASNTGWYSEDQGKTHSQQCLYKRALPSCSAELILILYRRLVRLFSISLFPNTSVFNSFVIKCFMMSVLIIVLLLWYQPALSCSAGCVVSRFYCFWPFANHVSLLPIWMFGDKECELKAAVTKPPLLSLARPTLQQTAPYSVCPVMAACLRGSGGFGDSHTHTHTLSLISFYWLFYTALDGLLTPAAAGRGLNIFGLYSFNLTIQQC